MIDDVMILDVFTPGDDCTKIKKRKACLDLLGDARILGRRACRYGG